MSFLPIVRQGDFGRIGIAASFMTASRPWQGGPAGYGPGRGRRALASVGFGSPSYSGEGDSPEDSYYTQIGEFVGAYTSASDPALKLAKMEAKVKELEKAKKSLPKILQGPLNSQIAIMNAEIAALREKVAVQTEGIQATRDWRSIGQTGGIVGVVAGVALVGLIIAGTSKVLSSRNLAKKNSRKRRWPRKNSRYLTVGR